MRRIVCLFCNGLMLCGPLPARALEPLIASAPTVQHEQKMDFRPFMARMQKTIKSRWNPPKATVSTETKVKFKVRRDGSISDVAIVKSSGSKRFDRSALAALKATPSLQALPAGSPESVDVDFTFDYVPKKRAG